MKLDFVSKLYWENLGKKFFLGKILAPRKKKKKILIFLGKIQWEKSLFWKNPSTQKNQ